MNLINSYLPIMTKLNPDQLTVKSHKPDNNLAGPHVFLSLLQRFTPQTVKWVNGPADILLLAYGNENKARAKHAYKLVCTRCDGLYHLTPPALALKHSCLNKLANIRYELADGLVFQSRFCQRQYEAFFGQRDVPSQLIVNGTDIERYAGERKPGVVCCTSWRDSKRPWLLAAIARKLMNVMPHVPVTIIGPFPSTVRLTSNCQVIGNLAHEKLDYYYRQATVFLHTAYQDPCPNSVVEAVAHGLFVVGSSTGGLPDICGNGNGRLIYEDEHLTPVSKIPDTDDELWAGEVVKALCRKLPTPERPDLSIVSVARCYVDFWYKLLCSETSG